MSSAVVPRLGLALPLLLLCLCLPNRAYAYSLFFDEPKDNATLLESSFCVTYNYTSNGARSPAEGFVGHAIVVLQNGWGNLTTNETQVVCTADPPLPPTSDCCWIEYVDNGNWSLWLFQIDPAETESVIFWDSLNVTVTVETPEEEEEEEPPEEETDPPAPTPTPTPTACPHRRRYHRHHHHHHHDDESNTTAGAWNSFSEWFDACIANTFL